MGQAHHVGIGAWRIDDHKVMVLLDSAYSLSKSGEFLGFDFIETHARAACNAIMHRDFQLNPGARGPPAAVVDIVGETLLTRIEIDRGDPLTRLQQCDGDVHRRGRLAGATFFVPKDDHMRRERTAELRLHQHRTQPLRCDYFPNLQRARSRYSIYRNKLIVNETLRRRNAPGCAHAATSP